MAHTVTIPSPAAGEGILIIASRDGTASYDAMSCTDFANITYDTGASIAHGTFAFWKIATGSEGTSISCPTTSNQEIAYVVAIIDDGTFDTMQDPEMIRVDDDGANPDPPSLSPTGGSKDYLAFGAVTWANTSSATCDTYPTGFTDTQIEDDTASSTAWQNICVGTDNLTASAIDPSAWTLSDGGATGGAATIVVHPASAVPPTFDTGVAYVGGSTDEDTMAASFDADATAVTYYCALMVPGASYDAADVKAGTGAHGTATGSPTGASQTVTIDVTDMTPWPYYEPACVLENAAGLSSVSAVSGTHADTPIPAPSTANADVAAGSSAATDGITDGASPSAVETDDVIRAYDSSPGGYEVVLDASGDGSYVVQAGGDTNRQIFSGCLWRLSDQSWECADQVVNNGDPVPLAAPAGIFDDFETLALNQPMTNFDLAAQMTDPEGDTVTCGALDALLSGLSIVSSVLQGTPSELGPVVTAFQCTDPYDGVYDESAPIAASAPAPSGTGLGLGFRLGL